MGLDQSKLPPMAHSASMGYLPRSIISLAANQFELDADKIDSLLWTEKSIKRLIDTSISDVVLPIRQTDRGNPDMERKGTQTLAGRVMLNGGEGVSGIKVSANEGNEPKTSTARERWLFHARSA